MQTALDFARSIRLWLYELSSATVLGVEIDILLHFTLGAAIYAMLERRLGTRPAAWGLAGLIVAKEIADLILKSRLEYIKGPTPTVLADIGLDLLTGALGGLAIWGWIRFRRRTPTH